MSNPDEPRPTTRMAQVATALASELQELASAQEGLRRAEDRIKRARKVIDLSMAELREHHSQVTVSGEHLAWLVTTAHGQRVVVVGPPTLGDIDGIPVPVVRILMTNGQGPDPLSP